MSDEVTTTRSCDWWLWSGTKQEQCGSTGSPVEDRVLCDEHAAELERTRDEAD